MSGKAKDRGGDVISPYSAREKYYEEIPKDSGDENMIAGVGGAKSRTHVLVLQAESGKQQ